MSSYKYLILRRVSQITLLVLYFGANAFGWSILSGTLSSSLILDTIPLSDPFAILQMLAAGAALALDVILGAIIIVLFYAVIGGRAFCSWVCPVNLVTDAANWLRRKLYIDKIERKLWVSRNLRYYMLVLALVVSFVTGMAAFEVISPITIFNRGVIFGFGAGAGLLVAIFFFDLFVLKNGWCGHICPLGGVHSIIGKYSLFRVDHNSENCTLCMKCKDVCPEVQVLNMIGKRSEDVAMQECTNCGRCVDVCDDDALEFHIRNYIKK
ncbi:MAG: quinol dehydrogenase ferredoxin subunit NapH [Campylobacterota bacterium]|nr:quinol dehydrogenase ferredoxin subunit NapH [Campylobacterota bacterium]